MITNVKNSSDKPTVVLDTNVFISALVFGGTPRLVTDLIAQKTIIVVFSEEILTELRRIVAAKFPRAQQQILQLERLLRYYGRLVQLGSVEVTACRDPDDNKFLETALLGQADYLVSGDNDLLEMTCYEGIPIIKPAAFLEYLHQS